MIKEGKDPVVSRYHWPQAAERLVKQAARKGCSGQASVQLHHQLLEMTGFSDSACWRYLKRHDIDRPGAGKRRVWDDSMVEFIMERGYDAAELKYGCTKKALYSLMQRKSRVIGPNSGGYGLNQLRKLFSVRVETVLHWIREGWLEANPVQYGGKSTYVVSDDQLRSFLHKHVNKVVQRRFPEKRIEFLANYLFEPKHADLGLLHTRESKREGEAFERGEYLLRTDREAS